MNENGNHETRNRSRGIFYGVIGIATLVVAIIGATYAYFTVQMTAGEDKITGDMASISFGLDVDKVVDPGVEKGLIPMSNNMIEKAVSGGSSYQGAENKTCIDDMGNAVCQIYKITVTNTSSTTMFVDGYVALKGGSGTVTDYVYDGDKNSTTMRWAQVFKTGEEEDAKGKYSTGGTGSIGGDSSITFDSLDPGLEDKTDGFNKKNILDDEARSQIVQKKSIGEEEYDAVSKNYIRVSEHALDEDNLSTTFDSTTDVTSLLVLNRRLMPTEDLGNGDEAVFYIAVWLSETGNNQTAEATPETPEATANPAASDFFSGIVSFVSAQGGKVTASFSGYTAVAEGSSVAGG